MPKFKVQLGRDATAYWSTEIEADDLEEAKNNLSTHGYDCPEGTIWKEDGYESFNNVEVCIIESPDGSMIRNIPGSAWETI